MINIHELERQWKAYKRKKRLPYVYASVIAFAITLTYVIWSATPKTESLMHKQVIETVTNEIPMIEVVQDELNTTKTLIEPQPKEKLQPPLAQELKPSFEFLKQIKPVKSMPPVTSPEPKPSQSFATIPVSPKPIAQNSTTQSPSTTHDAPVLSTSQTKEKIQNLVERFAQSKNPHLGIVIAQQYLDLKVYDKAYHYALEVNAIDQNNEPSWLIAAKALYYTDKKDPAQQLLSTYLNRKNSAEASKLLHQIRTGTLR